MIIKRLIKAIMECRTEACGLVIYECTECHAQHISFRSCGNRHCPACQNHKIKQWVEGRMNRQLPGHHFMITFTVPEQLRQFIRSNQRAAYVALFAASSQTLKALTPDPKYIGRVISPVSLACSTPGAVSCSTTLISITLFLVAQSQREDGSWHPSRIDFYLPVRAMSKIFRAKFCEEMKKSRSFASDTCRRLGNGLECELSGCRQQRKQHQIPGALCFQGGHLRPSHRQG